jgi:hypothetical protein
MRIRSLPVVLLCTICAFIFMGLVIPSFQSRRSGPSRWATDSTTHPLVGQVFPTVGGKALTGRDVSFPAETRGRVALVCVAYEQRDQYEIDSWTRPFDQMVQNQQDTSTQWYELPMVSGMYTFMAGQVDDWMRQGIPNSLHDRVVTYYGPRDAYRRQFQLQAQNGGYAYLLDEQGIIRFVGERMATVDALQALKAVYQQLTEAAGSVAR